MSYRRSQEDVRAARSWSRFIETQKSRITATGLPALVVESATHFDDFLEHGCLDHHPDPSRFSVAPLSEAQYQEFVGLVESYFAAGYAWFTPIALREPDQQRLRARFAGPS